MASTRVSVQPLPGYLGDILLSSGSQCTVLTGCLQSVCLQPNAAFPNTSYLKVQRLGVSDETGEDVHGRDEMEN